MSADVGTWTATPAPDLAVGAHVHGVSADHGPIAAVYVSPRWIWVTYRDGHVYPYAEDETVEVRHG